MTLASLSLEGREQRTSTTWADGRIMGFGALFKRNYGRGRKIMYNCSASDYFTSYFVKLIACSLTGQSALHVWLRFCRIVATINYLSSISLFQAGKRKKEREIPDTKFMRIQLTGNLFLRWNASTHAEAVLDSLTSQDNKTYPLPTKKDLQVSLGSHFLV